MSVPENQNSSANLPMTKTEAQIAYTNLIEFRQKNILYKDKEQPGLVEIHHIVPTKCGGLDIPTNKISLLAKEHFMAHVYLWVIHHDDEFHDQTTNALIMMIAGTNTGLRQGIKDYILQSAAYQKARLEHAEYCRNTIGMKIKGEKNGSYGKHWYKDPNSMTSMCCYEGQQPDGWIRGRYQDNSINKLPSNTGKILIRRIDLSEQRYVSPEDAKAMLDSGEWEHKGLPMSEYGKQNIRLAAKQRKINYKYDVEPVNKNKQKYINIKNNQIEYFNDNDIIPQDYVKAIGNMICYISYTDKTKLYIYKDNLPPDGYYKSNSMTNKLKREERRILDIEKHQNHLRETQEMADYYTKYGYEATCKKFPGRSGTCTKEAMIMRFCKARKKYGIRFESARLTGKPRKFEIPPEDQF